MPYSRFKAVQFGPGQTGLATIGYALYNANGSLNTARTTVGVTEPQAGTGTYTATISLPSGQATEIRWDTGGGSPVYASEFVNASEDDLFGAAVPGAFPIGSAGYNLGLLAAGQVTVVAPLSNDGKTLQLIPGMTYQAERGTGISWTLPVGAPSLDTAATVTLEVGYPHQAILTAACTWSRSGGTQQVAVELTSAQTAVLPDGGGTCAFAVWARWADLDTDAIPVVAGTAILAKALP